MLAYVGFRRFVAVVAVLLGISGCTVNQHDYKSKAPVLSVTIAVPKSMRHSELAVAVATPRRDANLSLGLYVATFRHDQLPTATAKRVPGASCDRPGTTSTTTSSKIHLCGPNGYCLRLFEHGGATRAQAECMVRATKLPDSVSMRAAGKCVGSAERALEIIDAGSKWAVDQQAANFPTTTVSG